MHFWHNFFVFYKYLFVASSYLIFGALSWTPNLHHTVNLCEDDIV